MVANLPETCCPPFQPDSWDQKEIQWEGKKFVTDRVRSFLHIPLNFGSVMVRNMARINAVQAECAETIVLSDENSLWGADIYIAVDRDVPHAKMATLSGCFFTKVYEGPYKNIRLWIKDMRGSLQTQGKEMKRLLFYYTTCPKCAKKYGKNYVVLLAEV